MSPHYSRMHQLIKRAPLSPCMHRAYLRVTAATKQLLNIQHACWETVILLTCTSCQAAAVYTPGLQAATNHSIQSDENSMPSDKNTKPYSWPRLPAQRRACCGPPAPAAARAAQTAPASGPWLHAAAAAAAPGCAASAAWTAACTAQQRQQCVAA